MTKRANWIFIATMMLSGLHARADDAPTAVGLQQLLDDKKYSAAVGYANRLLALKGDAAGGLDRGQAEALRGVALLNLKSYPQAADSFAAAAKDGSDSQVMAEDKATEILIRRSHHGTYTPKQRGAEGSLQLPIDIVDAKNRNTTTFAALFADEMATAKPKLLASKTMHTMPELLSVLDTAMTLRQIELTATGKDEQTKAELSTLATHSQSLISTTLATMDRRVADIKSSANAPKSYYDRVKDAYYQTGYRSVRRTKKAGLTDRNISELKDTIAICEKLGPATDQLSKASDAVTGWEALTSLATQISGRASDVLNADYSNGT